MHECATIHTWCHNFKLPDPFAENSMWLSVSYFAKLMSIFIISIKFHASEPLIEILYISSTNKHVNLGTRQWRPLRRVQKNGTDSVSGITLININVQL